MSKTRILQLIIFLLMSLFFFCSQIYASQPVAKISQFDGEVILQTGIDIIKVSQVGQILHQDDRIQTKRGAVSIVFNDGSLLKIRPFTNALIQERVEKRGFWVFKAKRAVRRITCFIGKLRFKSGVSKRRNYLQTPTSVCGLRGSEGDIGFDSTNTYLNMYSGEAEILGDVIRGVFEDPGSDVARKSRVYKSLEEARKKIEIAETTGKSVDKAKAQVEAYKVIKEASIALERNPDENIKKEAQVASLVADASIAAAESKVVVEEIKEVKEAAEKKVEEARTAGDSEEVEKAAEAVEKISKALEMADEAVERADEAAEAAVKAAETLDLESVERAAEQAKEAAGDAQDISGQTQEIIKDIIPPPEQQVEPDRPIETSDDKEIDDITQDVQPLEEAPEVSSEDERPPEEIPPPVLDTGTSEQDLYQEQKTEVSPSQ